jgi:hypothetical protein
VVELKEDNLDRVEEANVDQQLSEGEGDSSVMVQRA